MSEIEKAIKDLKDYIQFWEDEQADEDLTVTICKNTIESFKIAKQALEKQINKPLTLDEVKGLKKGDVVWLERDGGFVTIMIEEIVEYNLDDFMVFFHFTDKVGCSLPISMLYKDYFIYRNKPEEEQE